MARLTFRRGRFETGVRPFISGINIYCFIHTINSISSVPLLDLTVTLLLDYVEL